LSEDKDRALGEPAVSKFFLTKIASAEALLIFFAEHNGIYSAALKKCICWVFSG
jgi:NAD(P)H-dependent FMN reductase